MLLRTRNILIPVLLVLSLIITPAAYAASTAWNVASGEWHTPGNWTNGVPGDGDDAYVASGTVKITGNSDILGSFNMSGGTLIFTNWGTRLIATNVTIDDAKLVLPHAFTDTQMSNAVWFACSNNFTLGSNAVINVTSNGFFQAYGPGVGSGVYAGAGHGGKGGDGNGALGGPAYDSVSAPFQPGSGGNWVTSLRSGDGGGVVRIEAPEGTVTIFGTITADGSRGYNTHGTGGSGGAIYIRCNIFAGSPNGLLRANGGDSNNSGHVGGSGAGGRIAIVYNTSAQADQPDPGVRMHAKRGTVGAPEGRVAEDGTVYLPDTNFLSSAMDSLLFGGCSLVIPGFTTWDLDSLTMTNCSFTFAYSNMDINVTRDLILSDAEFGSSEGCDISCSNLILAGSSALRVYGGVTNGVSPAYGARVHVTNDVSITAGSWVCPYAHSTNGGGVIFDIGGDVTIASGGGFDANYKGFYPTLGPGGGPHPGGGGAYGGQGAPYKGHTTMGLPYGSVSKPTLAGSGCGPTTTGGNGGGLIWIEATNGTVTVNGTLMADGGRGLATHNGGAAGGGIYVHCKQFGGSATGLMRANGGRSSSTGHSGGGGGGGRIAVVYDTTAQGGVNPGVHFEAAGSTSYANGLRMPENGTVYLPDASFLSATMDNDLFDDVYVTFGNNFTNWVLDTLTVNDCDFSIANTGVVITVSNTVTLTKIADFGFMNRSSLTCSNLVMQNDGLLSTAGAKLRIYSGATNGIAEDYGALLYVKGTMTIVSNAWVYPYSHHTDGGSPLFRIKDLTVSGGGGFNATEIGYIPPKGPGRGIGSYEGGSYGGKGGNTTGDHRYGSRTAPTEPGSGAAALNGTLTTGAGGGLIRIESDGTVDLAGTLVSDGGRGVTTHNPGGSGGGIFLKCRSFLGRITGLLKARGGNSNSISHSGGGGGGGRIAVWRFEDISTGSVTTNADGGTAAATRIGLTGTAFFVISAPGITNYPATNITKWAADLVGELTSTGFSPTVVRCYWGTEDKLDNAGQWFTNNNFGSQTPMMLTNSVTNLLESQVYHYRWYATNDAGEVWATPTESFATKGSLVFVNTDLGPTDISASGAKLRGTVTAGTPSPNVYVCWGETNGGAASTTDWTYVEDIGPYLGNFDVTITNLLANHRYYYQAFVENTNDVDWADATTNFTTKGPDINISDAEVTEGDVDMTFTVSLSVTSVIDVTVNYQADDGSATTAGPDYLDTNGTITITASQMTHTVTVRILEDAEDEFPSENLFMVLDTPVNGVLGDSSGEGTITDDDATPETNRWNGTANWTDTTKWSQGRVPRDVDYAIIQSGNALLSSSDSVMTLNVESGATLTFTNWTTSLTASNVVIEGGGKVTLPGAFNIAQMANRIHFVCTNLTVAATSLIDANGQGFTGANTPGGGSANGTIGGGAGHGGRGERGNNDAGGGDEYDSLSDPATAGSAGGAANGGSGGGVVRIDASSAVTVHGTITANAINGLGYHGGGGSGGSVLIDCDVLAGSSAGLIRANGGNGYSSGGGGGGGRIAVNYTPSSQTAAALPGVRFQTAGGTGWWLPGEDGTLYLPSTRFLSGTMTNQIFRDVELHIPGFTSWSLDSLTIDDAGLTFGEPGFVLTVTNELVLSDGELGLLGNAVLDSGAITMSNSSTLAVWAGPTNGVSPEYGAMVSATGDIFVGSASWVYPRCDETNGGAVLFEIGADFTVESGGGFNAYRRGFKQESGPGAGSGSYGSGGGYGGHGAMSGSLAPRGLTYGHADKPTLAGSGGGFDNGTYHYGGWGGGLIWIEATNGAATISGTLTANGDPTHGTHGGGGSGGGIYLACKTFAGSGGLLQVNGNNGSVSGGPGGGGRIAVIYDTTAQGGAYPDVRCQTKRGTTGNDDGRGRNSEDGTTYLPDGSALSGVLWDGLFSDTRLQIPGITDLNKGSLTLDDCSVTLGMTDIVVNVTNDLIISNGSELGLLGNSRLYCGTLSLESSSMFEVISGPTNGSLHAFGALVVVDGDMSISGGSWVYPYSDMTNGGSPLFRIGNLTIAGDDGFNANGLGYQWGTGPGGGAGIYGGGGHGGQGGKGGSNLGGPAYGSSNAPVNAGSGGQSTFNGGHGGGAIRIEANGNVDLDGTLIANGNSAFGTHGAGGAGGSVFVLCNTFDGAADSVLSARGGNSSSIYHSGGGGGGGRIAVGIEMYGRANQYGLGFGKPLYLTGAAAGFLGTNTVTNGTAAVMLPDPDGPEPGTIVYFQAPPTGTVIMVW